MGKNRGYPQKPENRAKLFKNTGFLGFKPGFELPRPNAVEPWCRFADLSIFRDRDFWGPRHGQIPIHIQAFPSVGRPVMPSRRQLGPRGSVWRGLEAVEVPSGSKSLHFHVFGRRGNSPSSCLILQSVKHQRPKGQAVSGAKPLGPFCQEARAPQYIIHKLTNAMGLPSLAICLF